MTGMRIGALGNREYGALERISDRLVSAGNRLGIELHLARELRDGRGADVPPLEESWSEIDALLTLGGDGTLLRGARMAGPLGIPLLGCNMGRLGFLTAAPIEELEEAMGRLADGDHEIEERTALDVSVDSPDASHAGSPAGGDGGSGAESGREEEEANAGEDPTSFYALNDAVVHKSGFARLITLRVWVDGQELGQYSADGIVLATATGSTAYSLSAGGPVLVPELDALVATPICPHTLAVRSLVVPGHSRVTVQAVAGTEETVVTLDGQRGSRLQPEDRVHIRASDHPLRLVRFPEHTFFSVLRRKLRWGDVRPRNI